MYDDEIRDMNVLSIMTGFIGIVFFIIALIWNDITDAMTGVVWLLLSFGCLGRAKYLERKAKKINDVVAENDRFTTD